MKIQVIDSHHTYILILTVLFLAAIIASGNQENGQGNSVTCMDMFKETVQGGGG